MKTRFPIEYPSFYEFDDVPCILYRTSDGHVRAVNDLGSPVDGATVAYEATPVTQAEFEKLAKSRDTQYKANGSYVKVLAKYTAKS